MARQFSAEYMANERSIVEATARLRRIEEDRRLNGRADPDRERAHAAAIGALHGHHFRDAELYFEETGYPVPQRFA